MPHPERSARPTQGRVLVPQCDHHIGVHGSGHCPRIPRNHRETLFRPEGISGLPMPRYFENALLLLTGRTRMPLPSLSNSSLSPLRTPSARRTSRGTVICPLLVSVASFRITMPSSFPCFSINALLPPKMKVLRAFTTNDRRNPRSEMRVRATRYLASRRLVTLSSTEDWE